MKSICWCQAILRFISFPQFNAEQTFSTKWSAFLCQHRYSGEPYWASDTFRVWNPDLTRRATRCRDCKAQDVINCYQGVSNVLRINPRLSAKDASENNNHVDSERAISQYCAGQLFAGKLLGSLLFPASVSNLGSLYHGVSIHAGRPAAWNAPACRWEYEGSWIHGKADVISG